MSTKMMTAAFLNPGKELYLEKIPLPEPANDEVLIRVSYTGICGSDLHYYHEGRVGDNVIKEPHILGHESSGVVVSIGKDVDNLVKGDRVAIEPGVPCLHCTYCLKGTYNLCESVKFLGAPPYLGSFREYLCHKALFVHKLPSNIDLRIGSLIEPLSVGYNVVSKLALKPSHRLLITGAGPIGLATMHIAHAAGARVTIADVDDYRLNYAKSNGAEDVVNLNKDEIVAGSFDCAVEASGNVKAFDTLLSGVHKGTRIVLVGMTSTPLCMNVNAVLKKGISIDTVYRYVNHFQPVIQLLSSGRIDAGRLITHEYSIDNIVEAFKFAEDPEKQKLKVVIKF